MENKKRADFVRDVSVDEFDVSARRVSFMISCDDADQFVLEKNVPVFSLRRITITYGEQLGAACGLAGGDVDQK